MDELLERECRSASPVIRPDKRTSMDILGAVIPLYYSASHAPASGVLLPVAFRPPQQTNNLACVISFHRLCLTWMSFSIVRPSLAVQPRQWPILLIAFLWRSSIPESSHFRSNCRSSDATFFECLAFLRSLSPEHFLLLFLVLRLLGTAAGASTSCQLLRSMMSDMDELLYVRVVEP